MYARWWADENGMSLAVVIIISDAAPLATASVNKILMDAQNQQQRAYNKQQHGSVLAIYWR